MSVNREIWLPVIEDNFYSEWGVLTRLGKDDSVYVNNNKVYIPNAGEPGSILTNNTSYPVAVTERTDTTVEYDINSYQLPPVRLGNFDIKDITYNKAMSIAKDFMGGIGEHIMYTAFADWYIGKESGKHILTTGSTVPSEAPGATGNVKAITQADVKKAAKMLDKQKIPTTGRYLLLPSSMFYQLHDSVIDTFTINDNDGLLMFDKQFYGFTVVMKPYVINAQANGTARPAGHLGTTSDIEVGLAYHKDMVSIAKSQTFMYDSQNRPEYYGDIMSAEAWAGSKYRRTDKKGVVPIVQDAV